MQHPRDLGWIPDSLFLQRLHICRYPRRLQRRSVQLLIRFRVERLPVRLTNLWLPAQAVAAECFALGAIGGAARLFLFEGATQLSRSPGRLFLAAADKEA